MFDHYRTKLQEGGRIVIPADMRKALGINSGEEVILRITDDELRIYTARQALTRMQQLVEKYSKNRGRKSMADELIAERRREAKLEDQKMAKYIKGRKTK